MQPMYLKNKKEIAESENSSLAAKFNFFRDTIFK